jgi:hypothetical protein
MPMRARASEGGGSGREAAARVLAFRKEDHVRRFIALIQIKCR